MAELYSVRMRAAQGGPHEKGGHHISCLLYTSL